MSYTETITPRSSLKEGVLESLENSQENTCVAVSFFKKVAGLWPATLLKKILQHRYFCEFCNFLRTAFFTEHPRWGASAYGTVV